MTARIPLIAKPAWTSEEEKTLQTLLTCGVHPTEIGKQLNRSEGAIRHRMTKLGLRPKRGKRTKSTPRERLQALINRDLELSRETKGKEKSFANHHERQFMEYLRGMAWIKERILPPSDRLATLLLKKGWIEKRRQENENFYRMTEVGLAALKAPVPIQESWSKPQSPIALKAKGK